MDNIGRIADPSIRLERATSILVALYSTCKKTVLEGVTNTSRYRNADWGILRKLQPRQNQVCCCVCVCVLLFLLLLPLLLYIHRTVLQTTIMDMVNTWFNNVNIYMEATAGVYELVNDLSEVSNATFWSGNLDMDLWRYVQWADQYLRHNQGHLFTKVRTGLWEGYYSFLATVEWAEQNQHTNITQQNLIYIGLGILSTNHFFSFLFFFFFFSTI